MAPIDRFHEQARRLGVRVIHVRSVLRAGGEDDTRGNLSAWRLTFPRFVGDIPNAAEHALEGSRWTEFVTRVEGEDLVVSARSACRRSSPPTSRCCSGTCRVNTVVFNGGMTDCCIINAAFDAANRDFRVVVARDLVAGTSDELEDAALKMISIHLGVVIDSEDLTNTWQTARR